jgi:hypothetical protein
MSFFLVFNACMPRVYVHLRTHDTSMACTCVHETLTCTGGNEKHVPAQLEITAKAHAKRYHSTEKRGAPVKPSGLHKTSHKPARSFQQTHAQEICSVDVFRNTRAENMVQHSSSNHVGHNQRHTNVWHLSLFELSRTCTRTHAHIRTPSNHECTCMPDQEIKNHNISFPAILECTAQAGPLAYTLRTKTLSYNECAGHACLRAYAHTRTQSLNWKHTHTHTHTQGLYFAILHCTCRPV